MGVGAMLPQVIASKRKVRFDHAVAVCINADNFDEAVCRDDSAICCGNVLRRIQAKCDIGKFIVIADAKDFVHLKHLLQTHLDFLAFIVEARRNFCYVDLLAGIYKLYLLAFLIEYHTERRLGLTDLIFPQIELLAGSNSVSGGRNGIDYIAFCGS